MFYTVTDNVTDLVNTKHMGNRQQDSRPCLVHSVDRFDSEGWFSCNQSVSCVLVKSMQHLSEKMQLSGFLFPQVVQKLCDGAQMAIFGSCISSELRATRFRSAF